MPQMNLSARAYHRVLKLARTIADPSSGSGQARRGVSAHLHLRLRRSAGASVQPAHLAVAIQYRPRRMA